MIKQIVIWFIVLAVWFAFGIYMTRAESLYLGQRSHHFSPSSGIKREVHTLIIYERNDGYFTGYWRNSYDKNTLGFGRRFSWYRSFWGRVDAGAKLGLVSGYPYLLGGSFYFDLDSLSCNFLPSQFIACGFKLSM